VFKELLDGLRDEQLEGRVNTREEALGWLASITSTSTNKEGA